jgi:hypothetical protein
MSTSSKTQLQPLKPAIERLIDALAKEMVAEYLTAQAAHINGSGASCSNHGSLPALEAAA